MNMLAGSTSDVATWKIKHTVCHILMKHPFQQTLIWNAGQLKQTFDHFRIDHRISEKLSDSFFFNHLLITHTYKGFVYERFLSTQVLVLLMFLLYLPFQEFAL